MFLYLIHVLCGALFFHTPYVFTGYYVILLIPYIYTDLMFHLIEKYIPLWVFIFKCIAHCYVYKDMTKRVFITCIWALIYMWHNVYYLVHHAESRLGKIDSLIEYNRIAHLHYNLYPVDMTNRFHKNQFETNRLYMFNDIEEARKTSLGLKNYRKMIREHKQPRSMTPEEQRMFKAAKNELIFILNRKYFLYFPALIIFSLTGYVDYYQPINFILFLIEIFSRLFLNNFQNYVVTNLIFAATFRFLLYKDQFFM